MTKLILSKKKQAEYENTLAEKSGLYFESAPKAKRQSPVVMLMIKTIIVFLIIGGSMHCYMSGFGIDYNLKYMTAVAWLVSLAFTIAHTRLPLTVAVYGFATYMVSDYFNQSYDVVQSGIIAIVNASYGLISKAYKLPSVDGFEEIITDHTLTISAVLVIGIVLATMWVSLFVCRFMNLMLTVAISMLPLGVVLFFGGTPSPVAFAMLTLAWVLTAVVKFSSKYTPIRRGRRLNAYYIAGKVYYKQACDGSAMLCSALIMCFGIAVVAFIGSAVYTSSVFDNTVQTSKLKEEVDHTVRDTMIIAFSNYKNYKISSYQAEGELGFYGNITPDFETDLEVTLVPYTTDRMFFKSFVGSDYVYKRNSWTARSADKAYVNSSVVDDTANAIASEGVSAKISIENKAVVGGSCYAPYYSTLDELECFNVLYEQDDVIKGDMPLGSSVDVTYHPLVGDISVQTNEVYRNYVYNNYRDVPEELKTRIAALCSQEGLRADDTELDDKLAQFFQDNFKYDFRSGRLPWQTDFVEYFLFENRSGVCAHFATAATLMYRTLGIPARYVEGYCVDYAEILQGEAVEGDVNDWLSGVTPLSGKVMRAELSDYNAHAWVEIYKDGIGWVTVDPTPYVDDLEFKEEVEDTTLLEELMLYFQNGDYKNKNGGELVAMLARSLKAVVRPIACVALLVLLCFALRPSAYALLRYYRLKTNGTRYVGKMYDYLTALAIYCGVTAGELSFREFFATLGVDGSVLKCTEKALYSKDGITSDELNTLSNELREIRKLILGKTSLVKRVIAYFIIVK